MREIKFKGYLTDSVSSGYHSTAEIAVCPITNAFPSTLCGPIKPTNEKPCSYLGQKQSFGYQLFVYNVDSSLHILTMETMAHRFASIIIPTYNQPELTRQTLESLARQSSDCFEVIVVDDGSKEPLDGTLDPSSLPFSLTIETHKTNRGRAAARNSGIRLARHELLIFLDGDMTVSSGFVAAHLKAHGDDANRVVIGNILFAAPWRDRPLARYIDSRGVHKLKPGEAVPYRYFVTGNASLPRALLNRAGLFDETFPRYGGEDLELACRLHQHGAAFAYCEQAVAYHHGLHSIETHCQRMVEYGQFCIPLLVHKHPETAEFLRLNWVDLDQTGVGNRLRQGVSRFLFREPMLRLISRVMPFMPGEYVRNFLLDVVTGGSYLAGYRRYLRKKCGK